MINPTTGQGIAGPDKLAGTWFCPTIFGARLVLDAIYGESWAAEKLIDIIPDDIWARGRRWVFEDDKSGEKAKKWEKLQKKWEVTEKIRALHKSARLYGTAMLAVMTDEEDLSTEWDPETMRPGTLRNFLPMDRYDTEVVSNYLDPRHPRYGEPAVYRYTPRVRSTRGPTGPQPPPDFKNLSVPFEIHATRVIRMDGRRPPSTAGWEGYEPWWGLSMIVKALSDIGREIMTASAGAQMAQEASIPVFKGEGMREATEARATRPAVLRLPRASKRSWKRSPRRNRSTRRCSWERTTSCRG